MMRFTSGMSSWVRAAVVGLGVLVLVAWAAPAAAQPAVYMRSNVGPPWGQPEPTTHMDDVFGSGRWQQLYYETASPAAVFSAATTFVYMEGGDSNANELEAFLTANIAAIQTWVNAGGHLYLNAAPNEGDGMSYGFGGVTLTYVDHSNPATAVNPAHPIFNGPFTPIAAVFNGGYASHASVSGGGVTPILTDSDGSASLAELTYGAGRVVFGGLTTSNFWSPQPEADNLHKNILVYANEGEYALRPIPTLGAWSLVLLAGLVAAAGFVLIRRLT